MRKLAAVVLGGLGPAGVPFSDALVRAMDEDEDEKDEDGRFDPVHSKSEVHFGGSSEVQVAMDEGAHAEHESPGDAPVDEETEKAKAEFLEALDGTATSDEEEPSAPR